MSASALALVASLGALAPVQSASAQTAAVDASNNTVGEVVVTAQRREERLTDVPIAITAKTSTDLQRANINSGSDLSLVTPGLNFALQGAFAEPTIRGIGTSITGPGADANVSLYIDGVYQPSQTANIFDFNNVSNVEVLKGPQGTLFGRNATGGAILVTTLDPSFSPSGEVSASYGRFNAVKASGYVTGPLAPNLAGNLAVSSRSDDGYIYNVTTHDHIAKDVSTAVRGKLLYEPTDKLKIILSANYSDTNDEESFANKPLKGDTKQASALAAAGLTIPSNPYDVALNGDPAIHTKSYGGYLNIKYSAQVGTVNSITSYQHVDPILAVDIDNTPIFGAYALIGLPETTFTQELNFTSRQMGRFSFLAGIYYYYDDSKSSLYATSGVFGKPPNYLIGHVVGAVLDNSESVFIEGNYNFTDRLQLILGGRFTSEEKSASGVALGTPASFANSRRWDAFDPRAVLTYKLDAASNVYFSFSEGFKSGNYNVTALSPTPVNPESVDAYEVGYKYGRGPLRFSASAFYYTYSNIQVQIQTNAGGVEPLNILQNAAQAKIYGGDFDATYRVNDYFRVNAGGAYTHADYYHYVGAILTTPTYVTVGGVTYSNGNIQTASPTPLNGVPMIRAPRFTADLTPTVTIPLPYGHFEGSLTAAYNSGFDWQIGWREPAYTVVNTTLSWLSPSEKVQISFWGTNITSTKYNIYENPTGTGTGADIARPWSIGGSIDLKFK
ncbi:MAG: TonB-dependent receptor [Caulobacteraceae bacterium]|nr:TonB-dependent receptor [Caulobacteraceae bacterium]